jgi:uncharacterized iron-regulated membrane protein
MKEKKEKSIWSRVRELFNTIHLWLGIGSGLIVFVICLTGTIYTFSTEIQKITDSELYTVQIDGEAKRLPVETLIAGLPDSLKRGVVQSLIIPEALNGSYQITIGKKEQKKDAPQGDSKVAERSKEPKERKEGAAKGPGPGARPRGVTYFVNPYSGAVLGTNETGSSAFFQVVFRLHRWLMLDTEIGRPIVGVATLIFVVMIFSGLVIWFPKKIKNWKQGLKIKTSGNWKRVNHDLHNALGIYAALFLLVMALTGLTWSFEWYKEGFTNMFAGKKAEQAQFKSVFTPDSQRATVENILVAAEGVLPYGGDVRIMLPSDSSGTVMITKTSNSFFATSVGDRLVLDQYSTAVLNQDLFSEKAFGAQVVASIKAIHIGSFYGTLSKIFYFIACLIGTSLPVTGTLIWINKLRKKKEKAAEAEHAIAA